MMFTGTLVLPIWMASEVFASAMHVSLSAPCHERKPRLPDGTVTEDTDKYRLVSIPPSGREPSDVRLTRIRKAPRTQPS